MTHCPTTYDPTRRDKKIGSSRAMWLVLRLESRRGVARRPRFNFLPWVVRNRSRCLSWTWPRRPTTIRMSPGGGTLAILNGMFFTISVWERCCFQLNSLARVRFSRFLSGKGVVFRSNSLTRPVLILVWHWNSGKGCNFTFFSEKGGKFLSGNSKGKSMPPSAAHPYP